MEDSRTAAAGTRFLNLRYPVHIGLYGGLFTRILHAITGLAPLGLFTTGCLMWWNRVGSKRFVRKGTNARPVAGKGNTAITVEGGNI